MVSVFSGNLGKSLRYFLPLAVASVMYATASRADQVILDDLIVDGSACIGIDCVNGESFGFDTLRLKENNLRIKFDDTSTSASFPNTDWQLTANESSNGGLDKFSIDDVTNSRTPFTIEASAPSHSLYVEDDGDIGFGTNNPVVDLHVVSGNTPTLRLEQDGSSGFTAQTWDLAGNETNLFIRDATNGSTLPFRIRPGAPTSAIDVAASGNVGIGTASPDVKLDIKGTGATDLHVLGTGTTRIQVRATGAGNENAGLQLQTDERNWLIQAQDVDSDSLYFFDQTEARLRMVIDDEGHVGIGGPNSGGLDHDFEIREGNATAVFSEIDAGEPQFTTSSSREYKENIRPADMGGLLDKIAAVPVVNYEWRPEHFSGNDEKRTDKLGLIAEDFHTVLGRGSDKQVSGHEVQMALWAAVQQLHAENKTLSRRLLELEGKVDSQDSVE
jgi:hypothetical protein